MSIEQDGNDYEGIEKRHAQVIKLETFDRFVDLALDGVVTMDEAITGFKELYADNVVPFPQRPPEPPDIVA